MRRPGEVVLAGDLILTIAERQPTEVVAYARENQVKWVHEGMAVELGELARSGGKAQIARSQISRVGPTIEQMPQRLWRNPAVPEWGQPFLVKIPPAMVLVIGERVGIRRL